MEVTILSAMLKQQLDHTAVENLLTPSRVIGEVVRSSREPMMLSHVLELEPEPTVFVPQWLSSLVKSATCPSAVRGVFIQW